MQLDQPIFFFHIPKTAGSTLQLFMRQQVASAYVCPTWSWTSLLNLDKAELARYKLFQGHYYGQSESVIGRPCFSFTILRDPIERALSHYGHVVRDPEHYLHRRAMELGDIDAYLEDPVTRMTVSNFQARMLALDVDVEALYRALTEAQKEAWFLEQFIETNDFGMHEQELLAAAKKKLASFDFFGVTERLSESIALLCYKLSLKCPDKITDQNVNISRPKRWDVAQSTIARLEQLNSVDLALYEWAQQEFHKQFMHVLADLINQHATKGWARLLPFFDR